MTAPTELSELEQGGGGAGGRRVALSCLIITLVAPRTLTSHQVSTISCKITTLPGLISLKQYFYSHLISLLLSLTASPLITARHWSLVSGRRWVSTVVTTAPMSVSLMTPTRAGLKLTLDTSIQVKHQSSSPPTAPRNPRLSLVATTQYSPLIGGLVIT